MCKYLKMRLLDSGDRFFGQFIPFNALFLIRLNAFLNKCASFAVRQGIETFMGSCSGKGAWWYLAVAQAFKGITSDSGDSFFRPFIPFNALFLIRLNVFLNKGHFYRSPSTHPVCFVVFLIVSLGIGGSFLKDFLGLN